MARLILLALLAGPAAAQSPGCGYGLGLEALRAGQAALAAEPDSLSAGREAGTAAAEQLAAAAGRFAGCGCARLGDQAREAAAIAAEAGAAAEREAVRRILARARFSAGRAREAADRQGCR